MSSYKHTQIGYLIIVVAIVMTAFFIWANLMARAEAPSVDSGTNLLVTAVMVLIVFILASFSTLTTTVDENNIRIKFGYGIFAKKFALSDVASVQKVKNHWYYGWGIRFWPSCDDCSACARLPSCDDCSACARLPSCDDCSACARWSPMWIYNVSGFDAVQITLKNGKVYRIGTDEPEGLEGAIKKSIGVK